MDFQAFVKEQKVLNPLTGENPIAQKAVYKEMFKGMKAKQEAEKTPEQKAKEKSDKALAKARLKEKLKLYLAAAQKPTDEKQTEPVKAKPVKAKPIKVMPNKIPPTSWTAFVQKMGSVKMASRARDADRQAYEAFAAKWRKDNKWDERQKL